METSPAPGLIRSALTPAKRRTTAIAAACAAGLLASGALLGRLTGGEVAVVPVVATSEAPTLPAPVVNVTAPAAQVVVQPPAPPPAPEPPPRKAPRALAPHIDAACLLPAAEGESRRDCEWDEGFPAVSTDGALIAVKRYGDERGFEIATLAIELIDAGTSKVVRRMPLIVAADFGDDGRPRPGMEARVERRAAVAMGALDAQGFRSLVQLGGSNLMSEPSEEEPPAEIHAQIDGGAVRIVDPARGAVLWRQRFSTGAPNPKPDTEMCGGSSLRQLAVWWDAATGTVLVDRSYTTGGCMCPVYDEASVHRIPASALAAR